MAVRSDLRSFDEILDDLLARKTALAESSISGMRKRQGLNYKKVWRSLKKMLRKLCLERYGFVCKIINGDTPSIVKRHSPNKQSRQASIDEFQSVVGFNVIIMSPSAAGMGLNVTAANHVIHYSRLWNPVKKTRRQTGSTASDKRRRYMYIIRWR